MKGSVPSKEPSLARVEQRRVMEATLRVTYGFVLAHMASMRSGEQAIARTIQIA